MWWFFDGGKVPEIRKYTWAEFEADVVKIANTIKAWKKKFKYVYGPPRGGLTLAVCLSHRLNLELQLTSPERYDGTGKIVYDNRLLVVDDIADTGKTLQEYQEAGYFLATLFWHKQSIVKPDISIHEKHDNWIQFPWEVK